jgi:hypothetical protein
LNVSVNTKPVDPRLAEVNVGGVVSTVELFVTLVDASEIASLPVESWMALFELALLTAGAEYATVTALPFSTTDASVNCTVEPLTATDETERDTPATVTTNALVGAVTAFNVSLYVSVNTRPVEPTAAELNVGAVMSTVELFVTLVEAREIASLPTVSWMALLEVALSEVGAV